MVQTTGATLSKAVGFLARLPRDWKVTAARTSINRFFYQMIVPYLSVYVMALGASGTELGLVNSIGMAVAGLTGPFMGWIVDRTGVKQIYLIGIVLLGMSYLIYGVAQSWTIIIIAMMAYWMGSTTTIQGCAVICGNSLADEDRVTAMSACETFASGLLGILGPMLGALLVTRFGGVNVGGIRPLFFICLAGTVGSFFLLLTLLSNRKWGKGSGAKQSLWKGVSQVFKDGHHLKRWLIISSINSLPTGMILPFSQAFAHEIKGADQYVLGAMVTGMAVVPLLLGMPMGRLADRIGRKRVLYMAMPIFWMSNLMLIWAPNSGFLIAAGSLTGSFHIIGVTMGAMRAELVPMEHMGRWIGINRMFSMLIGAGTTYLAGLIWDHIGPHYVFLTIIALDLFIRLPLLVQMPETLGMRRRNE